MLIELGCFSHCENVDFGVLGDVVGEYTVRQEFNGQIKDVTITTTVPNEELQFSGSKLNENYTYCAHFTSVPPTSAVSTTDNFRFKIIPKI